MAQKPIMMHFRVSKNEAESIRQQAKAVGLSLSDFIRQCVHDPQQPVACKHCAAIRPTCEKWLAFADKLGDEQICWPAAWFRVAFRWLLPPGANRNSLYAAKSAATFDPPPRPSLLPAGACGHCEKVRRYFQKWLETHRLRHDTDSFSAQYRDLRRDFQELMPPEIRLAVDAVDVHLG